MLAEDKLITPDLFSFLDEQAEGPHAAGAVPTDLPYRDAMEQMTTACQKEYLLALLRRADANVTKAAELAGIERESFHRLMRKCGLHKEDVRPQSDG